jgi:hypothetical protein
MRRSDFLDYPVFAIAADSAFASRVEVVGVDGKRLGATGNRVASFLEPRS